MFEIYLITNEINGKVYIGKTSISSAARWKEHLKNCNRSKNYFFYKAIRKHGARNFVFRVIDSTESQQEANDLERLYIGLFRSGEEKFGYNCTLGGDGNIPNEATRLKQSISQKRRFESKEQRMRLSLSHINKHPSAETREKLRLAKIGKPRSLQVRLKIGAGRRRAYEKQKIRECTG